VTAASAAPHGPMTALAGAVRVPVAFFRRDRTIETSYRAGFILRLGSSIVTVAVFFFISHSFGLATTADIQKYGADYFAFVLVGVALSEFLSQTVGGLGGSLRESQTTGTLELMILSPSRLSTLLLSTSLWLQASAAIGAVTYLLAGALLGADFSHADIPATALALIVTMVGFTGMGLLAGAVVIVIKRGNPVGWLIRGASLVLSGVFYPTEVLPSGLQALGELLPMTHALVILRGSILLGTGVTDAIPEFIALVVSSAVYLALGLLACAAAIRYGRTDGSLAQY
jgi:ABC-2 type transport system permease protein